MIAWSTGSCLIASAEAASPLSFPLQASRHPIAGYSRVCASKGEYGAAIGRLGRACPSDPSDPSDLAVPSGGACPRYLPPCPRQITVLLCCSRASHPAPPARTRGTPQQGSRPPQGRSCTLAEGTLMTGKMAKLFVAETESIGRLEWKTFQFFQGDIQSRQGAIRFR